MNKYSPQLNVRSAYNFQESLITIDDYLEFAKKNDFTFAFYNDLNTMYGAAEFTDKFSKAKIKPIIAVTLKLNVNQKVSITVIAKNRKGYENLCYISSAVNTDMKIDDVKKTSVLKERLSNDNYVVINFENELDNSLLNDLTSSLEKENVFIGVDINNSQNISTDNIIAYNQISYFDKLDQEYLNIMLAIKNGTVIDQNAELDFHYFDNEEAYKVIGKSNANLAKIADSINFNLFDDVKLHFMEFKTPENIPQKQFLRNLTRQSLESYFKIYKIDPSKKETYLKRLDYELSVIESMHFVNYFLIVWDYVQYAKTHGIMIGPGRGSAAGSLVSFLMRITTVDPLMYDLLFERFLNPERKTMPDIDIDIQDSRREEVIEYLFEKYGVTRVASIVTYQTIAAKSAIRDVVRAYGKPVELANSITKLIYGDGKEDLETIVSRSKTLQAYKEENPEIFAAASRFMGLPRQTGTHAAGIVLSDTDLRNVVPVTLSSTGIWQTQYPKEYLERVGLIKMDLLGLRNLTILQDIKNMVYRSRKVDIVFEKLDLHDQNVFKTLDQGKTTGIFQLEGEGMTNLVVKMQPHNIEQISDASAIFRPGPSAMIPEYIKRKNSHEDVSKYIIDQSLIPILGSTYGIILYQEQVIQVLQKVGGMSLGEADIVRRAMSHKNVAEMESKKSQFLSGAKANGYSDAKAKEIWEWIDKFAAYGFNKSHSIAYSYISYWLTYLKTYYPEEFYTSLFNGAIGNAAKTASLIQEINAYGIDFKGPNIRNVNDKYVAYNGMVFAPLTIIKGIGPEFLNKVRKVYVNDKEAFDDIFTLSARLFNNGLNKNTFLTLAWAGAFDSYGYDRKTLVDNVDQIMTFAQTYAEAETISEDIIPFIEDDVKATDKEIYSNELDYLGFYYSKNPFAQFRKEYSAMNLNSLAQIENNTKYGNALFQITAIRTKKDKNGKLMAFVDITDDTANMSGTIFGSLYEEVKDQLEVGDVIVANIRINNYNNKNSAVINQILKYIK